ncbi:hypothetical protein O6H91_11G117000 [Diphasiastrum complanatum]|uniref:Uncharacterized protein n=1 Tax=Diphasiastrum complanatum TaxID=34168 RepID=A0ACC2CDA8_DIPCM|nr:hypothetical protein O6H91_11G117000 [Diphasiastrum complanatum]
MPCLMCFAPLRSGVAVSFFKDGLMELKEASEGDSPASNVCSSGESASSHSQFLTVGAGFEQSMVFPNTQQQQQMDLSAGELDQAAATEDTSCKAWDHQLPAVGSIETGADLSGPGSRADWDIKAHCWDWDNMLLLQQGKGDAGRRPCEWAITVGDAEVAGLLQREGFHLGLHSGSSKASLLSCSSGIPGVAATGRGGHGRLCSPEQKSQQNSVAVNLQNTAFMQGIEQNRRDIVDQQHNSDQQLTGQQSLGSRQNPKVMGFLDSRDNAPATNEDQAKMEEKDTCSNGGTRSGDSFIGLKLGKRTYFGDTAAVSVGKSTGAPIAVTPIASCSPSGKKRGSAPAQMPRCQVEGCKLDLSTAKDYHRRHKVCALHSKAAKVIVASMEQRFCQQCSRFHILTEFDEGKRSCRRRLAGHNERRRKPQPDPLALASNGASMLSGDFGRPPGINFIDGRRHLHGFGEPHYMWQQLQHTLVPSYDNINDRLSYLTGTYSRFGSLGSHSSLGSQLQVPFSTDRFLSTLSRPAADRLLMLLQQHPKALANNLEDHRNYQFQQESGPMGQALSLSPSSGTRLFEGLENSTQASHGFTGILDSGCALSLLSSQPWGSMTPSSASLDLSPKSHPLLERLIAENPPPISQQFGHRASAGVWHDYIGITDDPLFSQPLSQRGDAVPTGIPPNAFRANPTATPFAVVSDIDNHSMLSIPHGHDSRAVHNTSQHHMKTTIDLMQLPSAHLNHSHPGPVHTANREFPEFQSSRPFDSAIYGTHAML